MKAPLVAAAALLAACSSQIQSGLDESQANEVESVLSRHGVAAKKVREGGKDARFAVSVPSEQASAAIQILGDNDLPRQKAAGFGEVFGKGSMVPTATEEKALFLYALSGEIARTLETIDGVVTARIHVVPGAPARFGQPATKARASVLLKVVAGRTEALKARRGEVQAAVAGSVDGLDTDQVAVMITEAAAPPAVTAPEVRSENTYRALLVAAAAVIGVLALALVVAALRVRRLRHRPATPARAAPTGGTNVRPAARAA